MLRVYFATLFTAFVTTLSIGQSASAETIYKVIEEKPRFPGCEAMEASTKEKEKCAQKHLYDYISANLVYPEVARTRGTQGNAVVGFVIEKDGSVSGAKLLRDPGNGLGDEAMRVVQKMNDDGIRWRPGHQRGKPVRVQYNLPFRFKLDVEVQEKSAPTSSKVDLSSFVAPRFPGCEEDDVPGKYKYLCSQKRFVNYLERYIKYPKSAVKSTTQGKVIVSFIVELDGTISNAQVVRTPNEVMGAECLQAINLLNEDEYVWTPAVMDGHSVRSRVELPVDFRLGYKSIKSKKPITYVNIPSIMTSVPVDADGLALVKERNIMDTNKIYDDVEVSPYFKSCKEDQSKLIDRFKCSRAAYNAYIKKHMVYPVAAKQNRVQGIAKVGCVVEIDGTISDPKLLRDPGAGLGEEAMRLISQMKDSIGMWTPAEIGGKAVRANFQLNVRFVLAEDDINPLVIIMDKKKNVIHDCIRLSDPDIIKTVSGAKVKKVSTAKAQLTYGEKGRYGVYQIRLPKGKGKLPAPLRKQEEVEAYEMYFTGLVVSPSDTDKSVELAFDEVTEAGEIIVYNLDGRTILKKTITNETFATHHFDLNDSKGQLFLISITQKDLVHTRIVKF